MHRHLNHIKQRERKFILRALRKASDIRIVYITYINVSGFNENFPLSEPFSEKTAPGDLYEED